ncbi:HPr family phosphocarrier protein [Anoxybacterium hadale]|uniref:HPr family phosphocarrier protein n=1 Tax=Anoxybacterium hadale TaxID=3408580 RepID=A0ACD1A606_9FIRM|nr:HPr family phosphocarrier protein [Clostridiales bacterium]
MISKDILIMNETGIHARPAAVFVSMATKFKSKIDVIKDKKKANAKSILHIMSLGIDKGSTITISADGEDEAEAVDRLVKLVESKFGEE